MYSEQEVKAMFRINIQYSKVVDLYMFNKKHEALNPKLDPRIPEALKEFSKFPEIFVGEISYLERLVK